MMLLEDASIANSFGVGLKNAKAEEQLVEIVLKLMILMEVGKEL